MLALRVEEIVTIISGLTNWRRNYNAILADFTPVADRKRIVVEFAESLRDCRMADASMI